MTEITDLSKTDAASQFVLYWGDMGAQWGVSRSVAQIHALLYLSPTPMNAEQISDALGIARSNVSNSLKELVGWRLIRRVPIPASRSEHYEAETDVWEMGLRIAQGRKAREIDPAQTALQTCVAQAERDGDLDPVTLKRMQDLQELLTLADSWFSDMLAVPRPKLMMLMKMGAKAVSFLSFTESKKDC